MAKEANKNNKTSNNLKEMQDLTNKFIEVEKELDLQLKILGFENNDYKINFNIVANSKDNTFAVDLELIFSFEDDFKLTGSYNKEDLTPPTKDIVKEIIKGCIATSKSHHDALTRCPNRKYAFKDQIATMNQILFKFKDFEKKEYFNKLEEMRQRISKNGSFKAKVYNDKKEEEILEFDTIIYSKLMKEEKHINEICIALEQYSFKNLTPISKVIEIIDE